MEKDIQLIQQRKCKKNKDVEKSERDISEFKDTETSLIKEFSNINDSREGPNSEDKALSDNEVMKGYIAMLAVNDNYRKQNIGWNLVCKTVERMKEIGCSEIYLEAEGRNIAAIQLYEKLGFLKEERLLRYYLSGGDAYRLKLFLD